MEKPIRATVKPAEVPPSPERLGEIAEQLLQILAEERAKKRLHEGANNGTRHDAA